MSLKRVIEDKTVRKPDRNVVKKGLLKTKQTGNPSEMSLKSGIEAKQAGNQIETVLIKFMKINRNGLPIRPFLIHQIVFPAQLSGSNKSPSL